MIVVASIVLVRYGALILRNRFGSYTILMTGVWLAWFSTLSIRVYFAPHFHVEMAGRPEWLGGINAFYAQYHLTYILDISLILVPVAALMHLHTSAADGRFRYLIRDVAVAGVFAAIPIVFMRVFF